jgi:hypothetical protein
MDLFWGDCYSDGMLLLLLLLLLLMAYHSSADSLCYLPQLGIA